MIKKVLNQTLSAKAEKAIIEHYLQSKQSQLEPEEVLAKRLGVSRMTIREAMSSLVQKGYLTKRKGKGNFLHRSAIQASMRIDRINSLGKMLLQAGYTPSLARTILDTSRPSTEEVGRNLNCAEGDLGLNLFWDFLADQQPAARIYCQVPERLFYSEPPDNVLHGNEVFQLQNQFFNEFCGLEINHYISQIHTACNPEVNRHFDLKDDTYLVALQQYYYTLDDQCVAYSDIFLNSHFYKLNIFSRYEFE